MRDFINTKIDPVIILSCFIMNTYRYLDEVVGEKNALNINEKFVEEAIKKSLEGEVYDKELIDMIRSLVFCGKNMVKEGVFIHIWTLIISKFLPTHIQHTTEV